VSPTRFTCALIRGHLGYCGLLMTTPTKAKLVQTDALLSLEKVKISIDNYNGTQIDYIIR
jgi:hypothetical protein